MKKRGFTLIELLAVIVILAIIALISVPIILNIIGSVQEESLSVIKGNMEKAAELYVFANLDEFNLKEGEKEYIQLSQLEENYLKKVNNPAGSDACEGYVKVEKIDGNLSYSAYLDCGDGQNLLVNSSYVNYGGDYLDNFNSIKKTTDGGYIVVGHTNSTSYSGNNNKGDNVNDDAVIVKYDSNGIEQWSRNFGGSSTDRFYDIVEVNDGYVVVGQTNSKDGDLTGLETGDHNSLLVKYNKQGIVVTKKILFTRNGTSGSTANNILYHDGYYYVGGNSRGVNGLGGNLMYLSVYDSDFNHVGASTYGGTRASRLLSMKINSNGNIMLVGFSSSVDGEMADIKIGAVAITDAVMFEVDKDTRNIISKGIFGGTDGTDNFNDIVEVSDGYVIVGNSGSTDHDMQGLNMGGTDAFVAKYSKTPDANGILPKLWTKVIGGSNGDILRKIVKNGNELVMIGESNSIDADLSGITKANNEYYDGLVVKMDLNGNILTKKTYGGSKSDYLSDIIIDENKLVIIGRSFSTDGDIEPFNLGNSDAIMINLDLNLNPINNFQLKTLLKSVPKELVKNYGNDIPLPSNKDDFNLYTTNDATKDLNGWCTTAPYINPNANYNYVNCLYPFDDANIKLLHNDVLRLSNNINIDVENNSNWIRLYLYFGNMNQVSLDNFKITFLDEEAVTVRQAVELGYIEPLALIGSVSSGATYFFENVYNIIEGTSTGIGNYPSTYLLIKPKNKKLVNISFDSTKKAEITAIASITIEELRNFDISLTRAQ
jgi:prepilin-type N-terminal cleavage/methylation domain-containing protein